jgi:DNA-binding response OmpR family regulator
VLKGFALGAIDYLKKPIDEEELVVRIKAMLTRIGEPTYLKDEASKGVYHIGSYLFNSRNQELVRSGFSVHLSSRENELLKFLVQRRNQLCSHKDILIELWGRNDYFNKKSLNVFITHLRKYLDDDDSIRIENVHSQGFILRIASDFP